MNKLRKAEEAAWYVIKAFGAVKGREYAMRRTGNTHSYSYHWSDIVAAMDRISAGAENRPGGTGNSEGNSGN